MSGGGGGSGVLMGQCLYDLGSVPPSISCVILVTRINLKGPKREIFGFWFFAQIRPIWIG